MIAEGLALCLIKNMRKASGVRFLVSVGDVSRQ
jgi:hypothetical protein